jgi:hypothetical protein
MHALGTFLQEELKQGEEELKQEEEQEEEIYMMR